MKVELLTCVSGTDEFYNAGDIIDVSDERGELFCERGIARAVISEDKMTNSEEEPKQNKKKTTQKDKADETK